MAKKRKAKTPPPPTPPPPVTTAAASPPPPPPPSNIAVTPEGFILVMSPVGNGDHVLLKPYQAPIGSLFWLSVVGRNTPNSSKKVVDCRIRPEDLEAALKFVPSLLATAAKVYRNPRPKNHADPIHPWDAP